MAEDARPGPPRRTPLYHEHVALGGRLIDFSGGSCPSSTRASWTSTGRCARPRAVRPSHMGEVWVEGSGAGDVLELPWSATPDPEIGRAQYSLLCAPTADHRRPHVYRTGPERFPGRPNASNATTVAHELTAERAGSRPGRRRLGSHGVIAIRPTLAELLGPLVTRHRRAAVLRRHHARVAGTRRHGWPAPATREDGFELFLPVTTGGHVAGAAVGRTREGPAAHRSGCPRHPPARGGHSLSTATSSTGHASDEGAWTGCQAGQAGRLRGPRGARRSPRRRPPPAPRGSHDA